MPKVKIKRKSTAIDMTAMCDVAFLLLTFFILTASFKPVDPAEIAVPASVSERKISNTDIMTVQVDKDGKIYWGTDNQDIRARTLNHMRNKYPNVKFTNLEIEKFAKIESFGVPFQNLPKLLSGEIHNDAKSTSGIPVDSLQSAFKRNELGDWLFSARQAHLDAAIEKAEKTGKTLDVKNEYKYIRLALKGDGVTEYPKIEKILSTLKDKNINKFDLITNLKGGESASKGGEGH